MLHLSSKACQYNIFTSGKGMMLNVERNEGTIAIAIDRDKASCTALKWAVEHYIPRGTMIKLVHVLQKPANDEVPEGQQHCDKRSTRMFLPMRCLCMRRNIQSEVVLLDDQDVSKALIEYISKKYISTLVLGASLKKSITRLFKGDEIPSNVMRWAPDFCTVIVISKGRVSSVRSATRPLPQALPSLSSSPETTNDEAPTEMSLSSEDDYISIDPSRISTDSSVVSFYKKLEENPRLSNADEISKVPFYVNDLTAESENTRLKKELMQTISMYHAACKEALVAKNKALELETWKKKAEQRLGMAHETSERKVVLESHIVLQIESLFRILAVLFIFYFYCTLK